MAGGSRLPSSTGGPNGSVARERRPGGRPAAPAYRPVWPLGCRTGGSPHPQRQIAGRRRRARYPTACRCLSLALRQSRLRSPLLCLARAQHAVPLPPVLRALSSHPYLAVHALERRVHVPEVDAEIEGAVDVL